MSRGKEREHDTISRAHERGSERKLPHTSSGAANKRKAKRKAVQNAIGVKIDSTHKKRARLTAARFRMLNEELYTTTSEHHVTMFSDEQHGEAAWIKYHEGYENQIKQWPMNPLEVAIKWLKDLISSRGTAMSRDNPSNQTTKEGKSIYAADFGCGKAELSARMKSYNCHVYSFDLVAANSSITKCSMTNVPLENESIDAAIFCLSLMGVDYGDALVEASRVLRDKGKLFIAEVRSRFADSNEGEDHRGTEKQDGKSKGSNSRSTLKLFLTALKAAGFAVIPMECDLKTNSHFIVISCILHKRRCSNHAICFPPLKPCIYKKR